MEKAKIFINFENIDQCNTEGMKSPLNDDRLEAAWYVFRILDQSNMFPVWPQKLKSKEVEEVEELCQLV